MRIMRSTMWRMAAVALVTVAMAQPVTNLAQAPTGALGLPWNATSLEGAATVRLDATRDAATRHQLDSVESQGQRLEVRVDGRQFVWSSRGTGL